jgi:uncharacterized protein YwqG
MSEPHDRRAFFKELLRGAVRAAEEVGSLVEREDLLADAAPDAWAVGDTELRQETVPAAATQRLASPDELRGLCAELGLEGWAEQAVAVARTSIRLTRSADGSSRLGGSPHVPPGFEWPCWGDEKLAFIGEIRLDELPRSPLPPRGMLLFFFALTSEPSGLRPSDAGACRVVLVPEGPTERIEQEDALPQIAVAPSAELMLPAEPPSLVPDAEDLERWTRLREQLAALQGVGLEDRAEDYHALHRLLGYPDALAEDMWLDAELVARGVDLTSADRFADPRIDELQRAAPTWRLLFQLSSDDDLGVSLGYYGRLYVWIREDDLRAGRFDGVRAFVR